MNAGQETGQETGRETGREKGAALLEVLIAVAITAMLAAALAQATRFGLTVIERVQASDGASTRALIARRTIADLLAHVDPEKADADSAQGDETTFEWHGAVSDQDGWKSGVLRLQITGKEGLLSRCASFGDPSTCVQLEVITTEGPLAYAASDGLFVSSWPAGPPPHLIKVGSQVVAPRALGAAE